MLDDFLDYLGGALDKPGRAVRGLLGGHSDEFSAFIPFSDTLGITDPRRAVSGRELAHQYLDMDPDTFGGKAAGFGLEMALDPTTYLGGFLGRIGGRALGAGLEAASKVRGPGYATTRAEIFRGVPEFGLDKLRQISNHPGFEQALAEIPEGSRYLGSGAEAVAFRSPGGDVSRVSFSPLGGETRPIDPSVLPAIRTADIPSTARNYPALRVERTPYAPAFGASESTPLVNNPGIRDAYHGMQEEMASRGLDFFDRHAGNVGMYEGRPVVIDPGAVTTYESPLASTPSGFGRSMAVAPFTGSMAPSTTVAPSGRASRFLLDLIGGQSAMQQALAAGRSAPRYGAGFGAAGAGLGSTGIPTIANLFRPQPVDPDEEVLRSILSREQR